MLRRSRSILTLGAVLIITALSTLSAADECGSSMLFVSRRTVPVNTPTGIQIKITPKNPQSKPDQLSIVQIDDQGQVVKTLGTLDNKSAYRTTLTINESKTGPFHLQVQSMCAGSPGGKSDVITLFVQPANAADSVFSSIAKELAAGHIPQAANYFGDRSMSENFFKSLTPPQRKQLAQDFRVAVFVSETDTSRTYHSTLHKPQVKIHESDIVIQPDTAGVWHVISW